MGSVKTAELQVIIENLRTIAQKLKENNNSSDEQLSLLSELRENTVELELLRDYKALDKRTIAYLYISKNIITDFWANLGGDSVFGFEVILEEATKFSKQFGTFLALALFTGKNDDDEKISKALIDSIALYYSCLSHMSAKSGETYHSKSKR